MTEDKSDKSSDNPEADHIVPKDLAGSELAVPPPQVAPVHVLDVMSRSGGSAKEMLTLAKVSMSTHPIGYSAEALIQIQQASPELMQELLAMQKLELERANKRFDKVVDQDVNSDKADDKRKSSGQWFALLTTLAPLVIAYPIADAHPYVAAAITVIGVVKNEAVRVYFGKLKVMAAGRGDADPPKSGADG